MLNKAPIFLNCFAKSGSNIFLNMFLSHPDICYPLTETVEIFAVRGNHGFRNDSWPNKTTIEGYLVALLSRQAYIFDLWNFNEREPVSKMVQSLIDRTLYRWKLKTLRHEELKYKNENEVYTLAELKQTRLVAKNNNGLVFLTDILADMYPDATFLALVRYPIPMYESYKRRNVTFADFIQLYLKVTDKMVRDKERFANYHIIKFEDLMANPLEMMKKLYHLAQLDSAHLHKIRFKAKPHFQPDGQYNSGEYVRGKHHWFDIKNMYEILDPDINTYQSNRLDREEQEKLLIAVEQNLVKLDYGRCF